MHKLILRGVFTILALTASFVHAETSTTNKPFEIGVVPYLSARALIANYEPMRVFLEKALGKPVKIYTATGFKPFFLNAQRGDYDMVITAANFGRLLQKEHQFTPLLRFSKSASSWLVTALNSPIQTLQELRGKVIAVPDQLSMAVIVSMTNIRDNGMEPDADFHLLKVGSFPSAILSVQKGEAIAAITATLAMVQMPRELSESVRVVLDSGEFMNLIILTHPRIDKNTVGLITATLQKLSNESNRENEFIGNLGFGPLIPATAKDMNGLDRFIPETKRILNETP